MARHGFEDDPQADFEHVSGNARIEGAIEPPCAVRGPALNARYTGSVGQLAPEARSTMQSYRLEHLDNETLRGDLHHQVAEERPHTAVVIAHIAEFDARRLYLAEAYPSMFAYCVGELRFSEDAAYKRIQAGRAARRFPRLFVDVAEGRLHLSAVCLL